MNVICTFDSNVTVDAYGGKAYWTNWLYRKNVALPASLFIPLQKRSELEKIKEDIAFESSLESALRKYLNGIERFAVRSSAENEDGFTESKAGMYRSFLDIRSVDGIIDAIYQMQAGLGEDDRLGIIVQEFIQPKISGVVFSTNPTNGKKSEPILCMTEGVGDKLMSGLEKGEELRLRIKGERIEFPSFKSDIEKSKLEYIVQTAKKMEEELQYPVDMEWCIEKNTQRVWILQCRPMTGIMVERNEIVPVTIEALKRLPGYLRASKKVWLREIAEEKDIMISRAYLMICNCHLDGMEEINFNYEKSEYHSGYSVVLISPSRVEGKVQRFFVGKKENVYSATKCHRFGIREFASYNQVETCLNDLIQIAKENQWACSAIIQEILDAKYTGIVKKIEGGFLIEIAKGHFLSKGIIPMSLYVTDSSGVISYKKEIYQIKYIDIVEGCILEYRSAEPEKISISETCLQNIISSFKELLTSEQMVVEFGILNNMQLTPYLIDCMQEEDGGLSLQTISQGVISDGKIKGRLIKLDVGNGREAFDLHFQNKIIDRESDGNEHIIFYADKPSIQLVDILNQYNAKSIGFIFGDGSILCHFSVLLRERGIPAIRGIAGDMLHEGKVYQLDTMENEIKIREADQGENII